MNRVECLCDENGRDRCIIHRPKISFSDEPSLCENCGRMIGAHICKTLGSPVDSIKSLVTVVEETQKQLREALRLLNFRDRQIGAALDGLEDIGSWHTAKDHERFGCDEPCYCAGDVARNAINKMREIHKESLTANSAT